MYCDGHMCDAIIDNGMFFVKHNNYEDYHKIHNYKPTISIAYDIPSLEKLNITMIQKYN